MTVASLTLLAFFAAGLCIGSFLNVCVARWPRELSVIRPRSRCPQCGHQLAWFENVPLVSWIVLRARCRCCDEPISAVYPALELAIALVWAAAAARYGATFTALRVAVFLTLLVGVALTDLKHYLIPDGFTITGLLWTLFTSVAAVALGESPLFASPYDALVGACAGAGLIAVIGWLGEVVLKKEAMGMGDMTLMAFVGAALGPARALATVFVAAALGAAVFLGLVYPVAAMRRGRVSSQTELALGSTPVQLPLVPFGVFLAPAGAVMLFYGDELIRRLFGG